MPRDTEGPIRARRPRREGKPWLLRQTQPSSFPAYKAPLLLPPAASTSPARRDEGPAMPPSAPDARPLNGCLLLVLLSVSFFVQAAATEKESHITSCLRLPAYIGQKLQVSCEGETTYPESGIMYWLANGTFVDRLYPNGMVKEEDTEEKGSKLTRKLIFSQLTAQDVHTKFICFITDPSGVFQKNLQWISPKKRRVCASPQDKREQPTSALSIKRVFPFNEPLGRRGAHWIFFTRSHRFPQRRCFLTPTREHSWLGNSGS